MKKIFKYIRTRGFTDRLYAFNFGFTWGYTILCLIFSVIGSYIGIEDYSFVSIVCPLVWAELGIHTGFVVHKARIENIGKYSPLDKTEWSGNINIDV